MCVFCAVFFCCPFLRSIVLLVWQEKKGGEKKNNGLLKSNDLTQLRNARVNASVAEGWQTKAWGGGKRPNHGENEENQRKTTTKATFAKKEREFGRCTTAAAHLLAEWHRPDAQNLPDRPSGTIQGRRRTENPPAPHQTGPVAPGASSERRGWEPARPLRCGEPSR